MNTTWKAEALPTHEAMRPRRNRRFRTRKDYR